jgi:hypothetical protein
MPTPSPMFCKSSTSRTVSTSSTETMSSIRAELLGSGEEKWDAETGSQSSSEELPVGSQDKQSSLAWALLRCFSLIKNVNFLTGPPRKGRSIPFVTHAAWLFWLDVPLIETTLGTLKLHGCRTGAYDFFDGFRVLSIMFIILVHLVAYSNDTVIFENYKEFGSGLTSDSKGQFPTTATIPSSKAEGSIYAYS